MMKILPFFMLMSLVYARHGVKDAVDWHFTIQKIDDLTYEFQALASIPDRWKIPSLQASGTGHRTVITFADSPFVFFRGPVRETPQPREFHEPHMGGRILMHTGQVVFCRTIRRIPYLPLRVSGSIRYESCLDGEPLPATTVRFEVQYDPPEKTNIQ